MSLTNSELELVKQTHDAVVRMESKLDKKADKEDLKQVKEDVDSLKKKVWTFSGGIAALTGLLHYLKG